MLFRRLCKPVATTRTGSSLPRPVVVILFVASLVLCAASQAVDIHVPGQQPTIQAGIDAADTGDVVILTEALYTGPGNWDLDYGGKAITVRSQSGDPTSCVINCQGTHQTPHRGFLFTSGETSSSVLQGVTVRRGYHGTQAHIDGKGGGVYCVGASPRFVACRFDSCQAQEYYADAGWGGAVYLGSSTAQFASCTFSDNSAAGYGGAIACGGDPTFTDCVFENNYGTWGGAFYMGTGNPVFTDCTFVENESQGDGGALDLAGAGTVTLTRCRFEDNSTSYNAGGEGGAIYAFEADLVCNACDFIHNLGSYAGGAVAGNDAEYYDCLFCNNWVDRGPGSYGGEGGAVCGWGTVRFERCTLDYNGGYYASGIYVYGIGTTLDLVQTIITGGRDGKAVHLQAGPTVTASCTDIWGNNWGNWVDDLAPLETVNGNLGVDPEYCGSPGSWFYQLQSDSPCAPANNTCAVLIGARPVGCDTTPVDLAAFDVRLVGDVVEAVWRLDPRAGEREFRLTARADDLSWRVPVRAGAGGRYTAVDQQPRRGGAGTVVYTLSCREDDGWLDLRQQTLILSPAGRRIELSAPRPNPFNPSTSVWYSLARSQHVTLTVHDLSGRRVATLVDGVREAGRFTATWDGRDHAGRRVASGTYLLRLTAEDGVTSRRVVMVQ